LRARLEPTRVVPLMGLPYNVRILAIPANNRLGSK
jgi:hypothetical protein